MCPPAPEHRSRQETWTRVSPHTRARGVRARRSILTDARSGRAGHSLLGFPGRRPVCGPHTAPLDVAPGVAVTPWAVTRGRTWPAESKPSLRPAVPARICGGSARVCPGVVSQIMSHMEMFPGRFSSVSRDGHRGRSQPFSCFRCHQGTRGVDGAPGPSRLVSGHCTRASASGCRHAAAP